MLTLQTANEVLHNAGFPSDPKSATGEYVCLTVTDTGTGMSREVMEHIFEPFFTTKNVGKGTGLGLATVFGIVKQNRGFIGVSSAPRQSASFRIYLPRATVDADTRQPETIEARPPRGLETILLVEDEAAMLQLGTRILKALGYDVLPAHSPVEAMRVAAERAGTFHLLITDVIMPEMNGRELAGKIVGKNPGLKCLYISGYSADLIASRGVLEAGARIVQKPFTVKGLAEAVRRALDGR